MKWLRAGLVVLVFSILLFASPAKAINTVPYEGKPASPVIVTGYSFVGPKLNYVQLFNTADAPVDISGWELSYTIDGQAAPIKIAELDGSLRPSNYAVAGETNAVPSADFTYTLTVPPEITKSATSITLNSPSYENQIVSLKVDAKGDFWQRNISSSTGNYLSTFTAFTPDATFKLFAGGLYEIPETPAVQVSEILANPRDCSPLEQALDCNDYVKFYNPTTARIDLSKYRLRLGYQNQNATSSNTYTLAGTIAGGHFLTITKSADGRPLSLTNTGGFVWLEDVYGMKRYDTTVQEYVDASADSKKGEAWAYDAHDGMWKWTIQPTPGDTSSVFPIVLPKITTSTSIKSLVPCKDGQYRSEETNRCRSIATDVSALTPCAPDQERNPETNRCRKLAVLANALVPCKEGQQRNPETNRCRNVASTIPDSAFAVTPVKETGKAFAGWWALGGVGVLAIGYGVWEWRYEVLAAIRKTGAFLMGRK